MRITSSIDLIDVISGIFLANSTPDYNLPLLMNRFNKEPLLSLFKHRFKKGEPTFNPEKIIKDDLYLVDLEGGMGSFTKSSNYLKIEDIASNKDVFDIVHKALFTVFSYSSCSTYVNSIYIDDIIRVSDKGMVSRVVPNKIDKSMLSIVIVDEVNNGYFLSIKRPKVDVFRHIPRKSNLIDLSDCERKHPFDSLPDSRPETTVWDWSIEPEYEFLENNNEVKRSFLEGKQNIKKNRYIKGRQL